MIQKREDVLPNVIGNTICHPYRTKYNVAFIIHDIEFSCQNRTAGNLDRKPNAIIPSHTIDSIRDLSIIKI